ncbi:probable caffeoyl-CoA O-methyltransferase 2 isoform X5 [Rhodamnia argentea]|uniref:Probable caffeoyl-CoA O-methyltransferase 2 isoform X5 n=1 Tax=Rhodamnia argentea TaxID=178133 RepID=A0ABM3H258_9MYRT|nr:probable caffeoyl-CoA O-methyltransferase 2 isoform X5 [Rhodamnia argentea]XP_048130686.1 probable caffeoyl-CoA O-methyltransferase 2 isoform X5 [Rhodamnia argentea]
MDRYWVGEDAVASGLPVHMWFWRTGVMAISRLSASLPNFTTMFCPMLENQRFYSNFARRQHRCVVVRCRFFMALLHFLVSPDQAQLLAMLVQILGAERCIEVGVYTGYSSLAVALVLPESGFLVACERDAKSLEVAKKYYELAGVSHKVSVRHGLASDTLHSLILNGETCSYDFAFVDAEKRMNEEYFELLLQLVRVGGVIVIDNVLWHGKVADPMVNDMKTISIRNFNRRLMGDDRISTSMVPIGDGILICRKR